MPRIEFDLISLFLAPIVDLQDSKNFTIYNDVRIFKEKDTSTILTQCVLDGFDSCQFLPDLLVMKII